MKKLFITIVFLLFSSSLFAEFMLEPVICTTKKTSNCGAYIYNTKTGEVYFCDSEECKEVKTPIEIFIEEVEEESGSLKRKNLKFQKNLKRKNLKFQKNLKRKIQNQINVKIQKFLKKAAPKL